MTSLALSFQWLTYQANLSGRFVGQSRGKGLGGSSAINAQLLTFASRNDIDDWGNLGNDGWSYDDLAPYYRKFEDYQPPPPDVAEEASAEYINASAHGYGGPIRGSFAPFYTDLQKAWTPTYENLGIGADGDMRDGVALGGYTNLMSQNQEDHTRSYAGNRYYQPNAGRLNLKVLTEARVNNIIFDESKEGDDLLSATGLNFTVNGTHYVVHAKKEVIISAGTVESPKLLELSGIGNPEILNKHSIHVLLDNKAVGENLQDHPIIGYTNQVNDGVITQDQYIFNKTYQDEARLLYQTNRTGPLTSVITQYAPLSWSQILPPDQQTRPQDLVNQYLPAESYSHNSPPGLREQFDLVKKRLVDPREAMACDGMLAGAGLPTPNPSTGRFDLVSRTSFLAHPLSRGTVHIRSADPNEPPEYDPRYLSHPLDIIMLGDITLHMQRVGKAAPLSNLFEGNGTVHGPAFPDELNSTSVLDYVRQLVTTGWHPIGTCAMLPRDKGGVVSPHLKVYGTANVRIIDASIAPLHVRGNTQSLVYAIAEYGADIVKADQAGKQKLDRIRKYGDKEG